MDKLTRKVQQYWNRRPCNINHSKAPVGTAAFFYQVRTKKSYVEPHIKKFITSEYSDTEFVFNRAKVLDIGCGLGCASRYYALRGAEVSAVELSNKSMLLAQRHFKYSALSVKCYIADVVAMSQVVPVEVYDVIFSFGVLHHVPDIKKALQELKKYMCPTHRMRPPTRVKLMLYSRWSWKTLAILFKHGWKYRFNIDETVRHFSEAQKNCPVTRTFSKKMLGELLVDFRWKAYKTHIFPYKISEYKVGRYVKVWYFRWMPSKMFAWLESKLGWHWCIDAVWKGT